ncbi:proline iminopeptidase [Armillaria novae-zelandiae]|uniref:Proline iminopeptidase n=1 Tax=Armillaria novae-zelandiae TaxID=153914 RepID=A0AA39NZ33_9AGAR|nr:proline iminopeptidase [Armillaria novae-zelandiae]
MSPVDNPSAGLVCSSAVLSAHPPSRGELSIEHAGYQGKEYQTWYKVVGNLDNCAQTLLVVVHGRPSLSHDYLLPLSDLATKFSIPVIFYDQIGNSHSTHLPSKPPSFWTIDLFIDELPEGLHHLVLTNSLADMEMWNVLTGKLSKAFLEDVQKGLAVGVVNIEAYGKALKVFHKKHGCLVDPWPEELVYSMNQPISPLADTSIAVGIIIDGLENVSVPTFVINGRADIAQDFVVESLFRGIQQVQWVTIKKSSHTPMWEEQERYMELVNGFLSL